MAFPETVQKCHRTTFGLALAAGDPGGANRVRLRPILMTTFSIVAGLIPTAVGIGAGASQWSAIAVTIIGGQMLCLLLTLLVVPIGYSLVEETKALLARRRVVESAQAPAAGD